VRGGRVYVLFGLPRIRIICAAGVFTPHLLIGAAYGAGSPYLAAALNVQLLAVAAVLDYIAGAISKTPLSVQAGRLAFVTNLIGFTSAVPALSLIIPLGVVGACFALLIADLVRMSAAALAIRYLAAIERAPQ
jgi:hypothetical protein